MNGSIQIDDAPAVAGIASLMTAYGDALAVPAGTGVSGDLGGQVLPPGVYTAATSLAIMSGNLTLDAQGDTNAVWIFQIGSTLNPDTNSNIGSDGDSNANPNSDSNNAHDALTATTYGPSRHWRPR